VLKDRPGDPLRKWRNGGLWRVLSVGGALALLPKLDVAGSNPVARSEPTDSRTDGLSDGDTKTGLVPRAGPAPSA
jgi:hypothetical protein